MYDHKSYRIYRISILIVRMIVCGLLGVFTVYDQYSDHNRPIVITMVELRKNNGDYEFIFCSVFGSVT